MTPAPGTAILGLSEDGMTSVGRTRPAGLDQPALGWTVVLRRQPGRIVDGRPEGYTSLFEIVCCYCGDHPDLDYREVSPALRRIRGPYPVAAGVAAYSRHLGRHRPRARPARDRPGRALQPDSA
jgi:hypothetical protein